MPTYNIPMRQAAALNKKMQVNRARRAKRLQNRPTMPKYGGGKMVKFKPRIDNVVTRTFKYIFRTNEINVFSNNTDCFIGNLKNATFARSYFFNSAEVPGLNAFIGPTGPFTAYRIDEITYKFIAVGTTVLVDDTDSGGAVQIQKTQPLIYYSILNGCERRGEQLYQSEDQAVFDNMKTVKCGQDFKIKFTPSMVFYSESQRQSVGANITNAVLVPKKSQWNADRLDYGQDATAIGVNYYGFKILVGNTSAEDGEYLYKVYVSVKASFKGQSDNANQSQGTAVFNHRIYQA